MRQTRTLLLIVLALLAALGVGLVLLASIGDASVVASTGGVYGALEAAGAQDNLSLRNDLYDVVLRLKGPWAIVQMAGMITAALALVALATVSRTLR
jgi:hypothetical protein